MIYIVEDDRNIQEIELFALKNSGYQATGFETAKEFYKALNEKLPELILLDIMLPGINGYELMDYAKACELPVIFLTALGSTEHKVKGLRMGADDYLPKPFAMGELLARIRAMLRRREEFTPDILKCGKLTLNMHSYELCGHGQSFVLPKLEYQMMELFMLNQGIYLSSETILEKVWGYDTDAEIGVVWVYISYLRKKIQALDVDVEIQAKRGIGYRIEEIK